MNSLWLDLAARAGLALSDRKATQLSQYLDLLEAGNALMNLTRITDRASAEVQHIGDSLTLLPFLPPGVHRIADVGSGGGIPGIPLAIVRPDASVLLIESTKKKAKFLTNTVSQLGLSNVQVTEQRAEEVAAAPEFSSRPAKSEHRESFDVVVARAVATLDWLAEWCLPLAKKKGGVFLAMKGPKVSDELPLAAKAIKAVGGGEAILHPVSLPGAENHVIVEIRKIARTNHRYPRPPTQAKGPIG